MSQGGTIELCLKVKYTNYNTDENEDKGKQTQYLKYIL